MGRKKILIGSILAVALLTLVSFSNVVGYRSIDTNSKVNSPLFNIRTNIATDKEHNNLKFDYIGKDKSSVIPIPRRLEYSAMIQSIFEYVNDMDFVTYNKFLELFHNDDIDENSITEEHIQLLLPLVDIIKENEGSVSYLKITPTGCFCTYGFCTATITSCGGGELCDYPFLLWLLIIVDLITPFSLIENILFLIIVLILDLDY